MAAYNASMVTLTNELTQRRQEEAARATAAAAPKQPADKFPEMVTTFVRLCEVPTQQQLPPLYTRLANAGKQEVLSSIQALAEDRAGQPGSSGLAPIITPTILQRILYGLFGSVNADDIVGGLSIFLMMLGYGPLAATARQLALTYDTIQGGLGAPQLSEVQQLTAAVPYMPETTTMLITVYKAYATMLDIVLGVNHRVAVYFRDSFIPALELQLPVVEAIFQSSLPAVLPLFLHHTQLQFTMYFNAALL